MQADSGLNPEDPHNRQVTWLWPIVKYSRPEAETEQKKNAPENNESGKSGKPKQLFLSNLVEDISTKGQRSRQIIEKVLEGIMQERPATVDPKEAGRARKSKRQRMKRELEEREAEVRQLNEKLDSVSRQMREREEDWGRLKEGLLGQMADYHLDALKSAAFLGEINEMYTKKCREAEELKQLIPELNRKEKLIEDLDTRVREKTQEVGMLHEAIEDLHRENEQLKQGENSLSDMDYFAKDIKNKQLIEELSAIIIKKDEQIKSLSSKLLEKKEADFRETQPETKVSDSEESANSEDELQRLDEDDIQEKVARALEQTSDPKLARVAAKMNHKYAKRVARIKELKNLVNTYKKRYQEKVEAEDNNKETEETLRLSEMEPFSFVNPEITELKEVSKLISQQFSNNLSFRQEAIEEKPEEEGESVEANLGVNMSFGEQLYTPNLDPAQTQEVFNDEYQIQGGSDSPQQEEEKNLKNVFSFGHIIRKGDPQSPKPRVPSNLVESEEISEHKLAEMLEKKSPKVDENRRPSEVKLASLILSTIHKAGEQPKTSRLQKRLTPGFSSRLFENIQQIEAGRNTMELSEEDEDFEDIWKQVDEIDNIFNESFRTDQPTPLADSEKQGDQRKGGELFSFNESFQMEGDSAQRHLFDSKSSNGVSPLDQTESGSPQPEKPTEALSEQENTKDSLLEHEVSNTQRLTRTDTEDMRAGFVTMESFDQGALFPSEANEGGGELEDLKSDFSKKKGDLVLTISGPEGRGKLGVKGNKSEGQFQSLQKNFLNLKSKLKKVLKKKNERLRKKKKMHEDSAKMEEKLREWEAEKREMEERNGELRDLVQSLKAQLSEMEGKRPVVITVTDVDEVEEDSEASGRETSEEEGQIEGEKEESIKQEPVECKYSFVFGGEEQKKESQSQQETEKGGSIDQRVESDKEHDGEIVKNDKSEDEQVVDNTNLSENDQVNVSEDDQNDEHEEANIEETQVEEVVHVIQSNVEEDETESERETKEMPQETPNIRPHIKESIIDDDIQSQKSDSPEEEAIEVLEQPKLLKKVTSLEQKVEENEAILLEEEKPRSRIARWDEEPLPSQPKISNKFKKRPKKKKRKRKKKAATHQKNADQGNFESPSIQSKDPVSAIHIKRASDAGDLQDSEYFNMFETHSNPKSKHLGASMKVVVGAHFSELKSAELKPFEIDRQLDQIELESAQEPDLKSSTFNDKDVEHLSVAESMPDFSISSNVNFSYLQSERSMVVGESQLKEPSTKKKKRRRRRRRKRKKSQLAQQDNTIEDFAKRTSFVVRQFFDTK